MISPASSKTDDARGHIGLHIKHYLADGAGQVNIKVGSVVVMVVMYAQSIGWQGRPYPWAALWTARVVLCSRL